jgi:hypothetical protein
VPRTTTKPTPPRATRLSGGPASVWISRETHEQLRKAAQRRGQKLQWLADRLIADGIASGAN